MVENGGASSDNDKAAAARACFYAHDYVGARQQLQSIASADAKQKHNLALADYYASGCESPEQLLQRLEGLKQADGDGEAVVDSSLAQYNAAVLHFQLEQYGRCRALLEPMFLNIEPVDEFLAFRVCFLLIEVCLLQRDAALAVQVLSYLDRSYASLTSADKASAASANGSEGGGGAAASAPAGGAAEGGGKSAGAPSEWPNKRSSRPSPVVISPSEVELLLHLFSARVHMLLGARPAAKHAISAALVTSAQDPRALFLKAQLELSRGNARKAIKVLNSCGRQGGDPNLAALYFNNLGCVHAAIKRHHAAAFYFQRAQQENHATCGPHGGAAAAGGAGAKPFSCDRRAELLYNKGLQLLLTGEPRLAFACFQEALHKLYAWPFIWLRLGECCVAVAETRLAAALEPAAEDDDLHVGLGARAGVLGVPRVRLPAAPAAGASMLLAAEAGAPAAADGGGAGSTDTASVLSAHQQQQQQQPTLSYAVQCFRNALHTKRSAVAAMPAAAPADDGADDVAAESDDSPALKATAGAEGELPGAHAMRHVALLNLAWVGLSIADPAMALSAVDELTAGSQRIAPLHRLLAAMYAAEALCALNRPAQAAQRLAPTALADVLSQTALDASPHAPGASLRTAISPATSAALLPSTARALLATNMAVAHIACDDLQSAEQCVLQALALKPQAREPLLVLAYLELRSGNDEAALRILRTGRAVPRAG